MFSIYRERYANIGLRLVAALAAAMQLLFFYLEAFRWDQEFVHSAAPDWVDNAEVGQISPQIVQSISWAERLATNMGVYNLVLAIGLVWLAYEGRTAARGLGLFLSLWLLVAAVAAASTGVPMAFKFQGGAGLVLFAAVVLVLTRPPSTSTGSAFHR